MRSPTSTFKHTFMLLYKALMTTRTRGRN